MIFFFILRHKSATLIPAGLIQKDNNIHILKFKIHFSNNNNLRIHGGITVSRSSLVE